MTHCLDLLVDFCAGVVLTTPPQFKRMDIHTTVKGMEARFRDTRNGQDYRVVIEPLEPPQHIETGGDDGN